MNSYFSFNQLFAIFERYCSYQEYRDKTMGDKFKFKGFLAWGIGYDNGE